jgi:DNA-binding transcriptional LysR family regulator
LELTAEGSLLLARARDLRLSLRNVAREVSELSEGRAGHLRIGVGPSIPTRLISSSLAKLLIDAPRITARVTISDADEIIPALRKGELDLNINVMHVSPPKAFVTFGFTKRSTWSARPETIHCPANRKCASRS